MKLQYSSIPNLLLLPRNFYLENVHEHLVEEIVNSNTVFRQMFKLEQGIQPILASLEEGGMIVANRWFKNGIGNKFIELEEAATEINHYTGNPNKNINYKQLDEFWQAYNLPIARTFEKLSQYKNLHPTYRLVLDHRKHTNFLKQWGTGLINKGTQLSNGDVRIKAHWTSFSSYTGRITAKELPLTSLPKAMREYIVAPVGTQLISFDLSNAELRFLAYYAKCTSLLGEFNEGVDIHSETARLIQSQVGSLTIDKKNARELAKRFTYSFLYGAGVHTITKNFKRVYKNVTPADVDIVTAAFNLKYPELKKFLHEREESESLLTPYGLIRPKAEFTKGQKRNYTLQASVSVAIKLLLLILADHEIKIHHVIHDEAWIEIPLKLKVEDVVEKITNEFELEINHIFEGFPVKGFINIKKIGGK